MKQGNLCRNLMGPVALYSKPPVLGQEDKQVGVLEGNQTCVIVDLHPQKCYLGFTLAKVITHHGICWIRTGGLMVIT